MQIIYDVLREPLLQICSNAGEDGTEILNTIVRGGLDYIGYNAATGAFEDLIQAGVIDPPESSAALCRMRLAWQRCFSRPRRWFAQCRRRSYEPHSGR